MPEMDGVSVTNYTVETSFHRLNPKNFANTNRFALKDTSSVKPLLIMNVDIGAEKPKKMFIFDNTDPWEKAFNFVENYDLPEEMVEIVADMIEANKSRALENMSKNSFKTRTDNQSEGTNYAGLKSNQRREHPNPNYREPISQTDFYAHQNEQLFRMERGQEQALQHGYSSKPTNHFREPQEARKSDEYGEGREYWASDRQRQQYGERGLAGERLREFDPQANSQVFCRPPMNPNLVKPPSQVTQVPQSKLQHSKAPNSAMNMSRGQPSRVYGRESEFFNDMNGRSLSSLEHIPAEVARQNQQGYPPQMQRRDHDNSRDSESLNECSQLLGESITNYDKQQSPYPSQLNQRSQTPEPSKGKAGASQMMTPQDKMRSGYYTLSPVAGNSGKYPTRASGVKGEEATPFTELAVSRKVQEEEPLGLGHKETFDSQLSRDFIQQDEFQQYFPESGVRQQLKPQSGRRIVIFNEQLEMPRQSSQQEGVQVRNTTSMAFNSSGWQEQNHSKYGGPVQQYAPEQTGRDENQKVLANLFALIDFDNKGNIKSYELNLCQLSKELKAVLQKILARLDNVNGNRGFTSIDFAAFMRAILDSGKMDEIKSLYFK
jgi:hypothetical protein